MSSKSATRYLYGGMGTLVLAMAAYEFFTAGAGSTTLLAGIVGAMLVLQGVTGST